MTKKQIIITILIVSLIVIVPTVIFAIKFNGSLSTDVSAWGAFGSYLSPFISLAYTVIIAVLTYILVSIESSRDMPTLVIATLSPKIAVYNIGKAQALNIIVKTHYNRKADEIQTLNTLVPTDSYSFSSPNSDATGITVEYESIHGIKYKAYPSIQLSNEFGFKLSDKDSKILFG